MAYRFSELWQGLGSLDAPFAFLLALPFLVALKKLDRVDTQTFSTESVKSGHCGLKTLCLLLPRKRTLAYIDRMSVRLSRQFLIHPIDLGQSVQKYFIAQCAKSLQMQILTRCPEARRTIHRGWIAMWSFKSAKGFAAPLKAWIGDAR
jgi:hypothetical protein